MILIARNDPSNICDIYDTNKAEEGTVRVRSSFTSNIKEHINKVYKREYSSFYKMMKDTEFRECSTGFLEWFVRCQTEGKYGFYIPQVASNFFNKENIVRAKEIVGDISNGTFDLHSNNTGLKIPYYYIAASLCVYFRLSISEVVTKITYNSNDEEPLSSESEGIMIKTFSINIKTGEFEYVHNLTVKNNTVSYNDMVRNCNACLPTIDLREAVAFYDYIASLTHGAPLVSFDPFGKTGLGAL